MKDKQFTEQENYNFILKPVNMIYVIFLLVVLLTACTSPEPVNDDFSLPEGFTIESVVAPELIDYPMFASFDPKGRLFVFESTGTNDMDTEVMLSEPSYQIRLLTDTDQDGIFDESVVFADEIPFPMGGAYHEGSLYVAASPDILKFTDTNGDGQADEREVLLTGWTLNANGAILSGPFMGPDGWMYVAGARRGFDITTKEGERMQGKGARIWRFLPDGSHLEWLSGGGFDNSIEIDFMPSGDPIGTMTYFRDPADGQRDALMHWVKGGVYPKPQAVIEEDQLKLTGDLMPVVTKMPRVAPSGIVRFRGNQWGADYEGQWFSAIFNTGQVLQHHITPDGGSYQSEDEVFLSSTLSDFHPTDVLQDGNGDLLVIVTGGWFIKGCPLSRVGKPDVAGGIYRISKNDSEDPANQKSIDPWGAQINFKEIPLAELDALLYDDRPMVRQNALTALEERGADAVPIIEKLLRNPSESRRLDAIYALHRKETEDADMLVRSGLSDGSEAVRRAAVRLSGLSKDQKTVSKLSDLVVNDPSLAVRRQAATALGQMGASEAVPELLKAAKGVDDRFLLHAIRYALISMNEPDLVLPGLVHKDPSVRITALIALDQMDAAPLSRDQVRPFLESTEKKVQETGIWVMKHHPEWSGMVTDYLATKMEQKNIDDEVLSIMENLMVTFCGDQSVKKFVSEQLMKASITEKVRILFLEIMSQCTGSIPDEWIASLEKTLPTKSADVRFAALDVIGSRKIEGLETDLDQLLTDHKDNPELYLKILNTRLSTQPALSEAEFDQVITFLDSTSAIPVRRSAIRALDRAELKKGQLQQIARNTIPSAGEVVLPELVGLFASDSSEAVGQDLVDALSNQDSALMALSEQDLENAIDHYPASVKQAAEPLMETLRQQSAGRLTRLHEMEKNLVRGDIGRGRDLFFGKAICSTCHAIGKEGHDFGPDLTNIGEIRSRHDLLEAIVYPSVSFAREYETYIIKTENETYTGILDESLTPGVVVVKTAPGQVVRIPKEEVVSMEPGEVSLMPAGLDKSLTNQELSDLIAFLEALPYTVDRLIELSE